MRRPFDSEKALRRERQAHRTTGLYYIRACYRVPAMRMSQRLAVPHTEGAVHPHLLEAAVIVQGHLDAVPIRRPARSRWEVARGHGEYGAEFVDAEDRRVLGWLLGVERRPAPGGS
jgi:hypothetical protein